MVRRRFALALAGLLGCSAPGSDVLPVLEQALASDPRTLSAIEPLPQTVQFDAARAALGERLFADARVSGDGQVSCADCHMISHGGANGEQRSSLPARTAQVGVNVPTFFNVAFDFRFAWNGRFDTVEQQLDFAMASSAAMAGSWRNAVAHLRADAPLQGAFLAAYPEGLNENSLRDALATYCRSAITPGSRFDRFLRGEAVLTEQEQLGYAAFRDYACVSCHQGVNIGGNMFQRFGVMRDYFAERGQITAADHGRFAVTGEESDRFVFRVPSLRNVATTAPYFHDGSAATLEQAVTVMARYQLGRELPAQKTQEIVAFLRTLTGEYRGRPL